jgi:dTDP-4-dehydrorhamnose reductase
VKALIQKEFWGLYNMVCGGETSRYEVAEEILRILSLATKIKITAVKSDYFKKIYFADRPASERLVNCKLSLRDLNLMQDWKIALKEYIATYYQGYLD